MRIFKDLDMAEYLNIPYIIIILGNGVFICRTKNLFAAAFSHIQGRRHFGETGEFLKNMGIGAVTKELARLDKEELIKLLAELYGKDKETREFLDFYVNPDEKALHMKCRDKILYAFFPKRGYQLRLAEGKKAIADFKKYSSNGELLADLMLWYVENGVTYTNEYGDIDQARASSDKICRTSGTDG
jgi:Family of unknown function (DUF6155)